MRRNVEVFHTLEEPVSVFEIIERCLSVNQGPRAQIYIVKYLFVIPCECVNQSGLRNLLGMCLFPKL